MDRAGSRNVELGSYELSRSSNIHDCRLNPNLMHLDETMGQAGSSVELTLIRILVSDRQQILAQLLNSAIFALSFGFRNRASNGRPHTPVLANCSSSSII